MSYLPFLLTLLILAPNIKAQSLSDVLWVNGAGGNATDVGFSVSTDTLGNVYTTGSFTSPADFGAETLVGLGLYISKIDSDGNWLWTKDFGPGTVTGVINDADGNVYISGSYDDVITFGALMLNSSTGLGDIYVTKLNSDGVFFWATAPIGNCTATSNDLSFDDTNLVVGGSFRDTCTFGSDTLTTNLSGIATAPLVAKIDTDGNWLNANMLIPEISASSGIINSVYTSTGDIYVTGSFAGNMTVNSDFLVSSGTSDIFVAKLDSFGAWNWGRRAGSINSNDGLGITLDVDENVYITGSYRSVCDFGSFVVNGTAGGPNLFVAGLDSTGIWLWAVLPNIIGGNFNVGIGYDIVANDTSLFVIANIQGEYMFGDKVFNTTENQNVIASLDLDGNWTDIVVFSSNISSIAVNPGLAINGSSLYATGDFIGTTQFSNFTLDSIASSQDVYILKIEINGSQPEPPSKIVLIVVIIIVSVVLLFLLLIILVKTKCCKKCKENKDEARTWNIEMDDQQAA